MPQPLYSARLDDALAFVADAFRTTTRKGNRIPYLAHLLQVAAWVTEYGGDEDQIIAALLHDYLEDIDGGAVALLEARFGPRVAELVLDLSDTTSVPKPPWRPRKERYIAKLRDLDADTKLVAACDKLHNARSLLSDLRREGLATFERFSAPMHETLWYYEAVVAALAHAWPHPLVDELDDVVRALRREAERRASR